MVVMLGLDLAVFNRKAHEVKMKEAVVWSIVWITLALVFNVAVYIVLGSQKGLQFLAGYLIEKSLSVDNLFVFLMIFGYFHVPAKYQHRILFWGIMGALLMRLVFVFAGVELIRRFEWTVYVFGAFLIVTGARMAFKKEGQANLDRNLVLRLFKPITDSEAGYESGKFFIRRGQSLRFTPVFVVLLVIESTDVVFATESVPAVLAISKDPFIIYSSNIFAILGLRALYFALAGFMGMFHYLKYGLSFILAFVGVKMIVSHFHELPIAISLGVIAMVLTLSVVASIIRQRRLDAAARDQARAALTLHTHPALPDDGKVLSPHFP
jgi:tellurite resistance protein TerC